MRELVVTTTSGAVQLAGSVWLPDQAPSVGLLMHPGSGPSDRTNDGYFVPIRDHLVAQGIAVAGFDKRGVGGSAGSWHDAAIIDQADDALAALECVRRGAELDGIPVGLFGHSQGGWVVVEAAARGDVPFVVCNSGPGVSPALQERFALTTALVANGLDPAPHLAKLDRSLALLRRGAPYAEVLALGDAVHPYAPDDEPTWRLWQRMMDHDPEPALRQLRVPVLALFGEHDHVVPVDDSIAVFTRAVAHLLLTLAVVPGGDHRLQVGTPPRLAEGYLHQLTSFLLDRVPGSARP